MPASTHTKAAEAQEAVAKSHRAAAEQHQKGDHKGGCDTAEKALKMADHAQTQSKGAAEKSKAACH